LILSRIFGVGTKRAVVALAQNVKIKTCYKQEKSHQIEFDDDWIKDDGTWDLPVYEIDPIPSGTTVVELQKLRIHLTKEIVDQLKLHLQATYARFIENKSVSIEVNRDLIKPVFFDNWAYPPDFSPRKYVGVLNTENGREIQVEAYAGLSVESSPATGEYGVYFYCNDRLVARALKTFEVGFIKGFAGVAHPKVSLTRVIIFLSGDAQSMPWNSSKSDINTRHEVFIAMHKWLLEVVKDYAQVSRIWMGDWPDKVFKYKTGTIDEIKIDNFPEVKTSYLPGLPKIRLRFGEKVSQRNKSIAAKKPWTKGLYEGVIAVDVVSKQHLAQKNRIALILLDSTIEIAFKEYLVNEVKTYYSDAQLAVIFSKRHLVHDEIKKHKKQVSIADGDWKKLSYYNGLRNKLVHERASAGISNADIEEFRSLVEKILAKLYKLNFSA